MIRRVLKPSPTYNHVRVMKSFASWLYAEGYTPENVLARLALPKVCYSQRYRRPAKEPQLMVKLLLLEFLYDSPTSGWSTNYG